MTQLQIVTDIFLPLGIVLAFTVIIFLWVKYPNGIPRKGHPFTTDVHPYALKDISDEDAVNDEKKEEN
jgi:hypothetical protein